MKLDKTDRTNGKRTSRLTAVVIVTSLVLLAGSFVGTARGNIQPAASIVPFSGMYVEYRMWSGGNEYTAKIEYTLVSGNTYQARWYSNGAEIGSWTVDGTTRVVTAGVGSSLLTGSHDFTWIPTSTQLGNVIGLSVDGAGDIPHTVASDKIVTLSSGRVDAWYLTSNTYAGGYVEYEKSTGICLNALLKWGGGEITFVFKSTNIAFNLPTSDIVWIIVGCAGGAAAAIIIIAVVVKKKKAAA